MTKQSLFLFLFFLFLVGETYSQSFLITSPKLEFDGTQLIISYDIISKIQSDKFYVWVEIEKKNGEPIHAMTLSGNVGENISPGLMKQITWFLERDSVFLDEDILVEVKAEKYVKSFNRGSVMLMSTVMPGLGQTKINKGKPWWLTGVVTYGTIASGLIVYNSYHKTYDSYVTEEDPSKRDDLFNKAQQQIDISGVLIASGASLWAANIIWVAVIPNRYKPLQHVNLSLDQSNGPFKGTTLLSLRFNF